MVYRVLICIALDLLSNSADLPHTITNCKPKQVNCVRIKGVSLFKKVSLSC
jgi:hypothetical protein